MTHRYTYPRIFRITAALVILSVLLSNFPVNAAVPLAPSTNHSRTIPLPAGLPAESVAAVPANPLSVSRVQSSYLASSVDHTLTITYTVTNNQPPTIFPAIPPGATVTETIELAADFDNRRDPNTLRNVLLTTALTAVASYDSATPIPDRNGTTLAWNLGDVPPLTSKTAVLTLNAPTSVTSFTDLDAGAAAWGVLQGRAVSTSTAPAGLVPADFSQWLIWTVDADRYDSAMLARSAELGQDPTALFEFVRGLGYESYAGSLRGTPGTLWSNAGNSVDQASLLIAMLRAAGIPARYRHGALSTSDAQALIVSMFPSPTQFTGYVPPETVVADPINDASLLVETADHWWVEAYLPGQGWVDMDPTFANAAIGQSFATPAADGTDRIAELPDALRHKVSIRLKIENYHPLNSGNSNLGYNYPLDYTFNTVEIATRPVTFAHLVDTQGQPGLAFTTVTHTYTPYLLIGEELFLGESYQDVFTNFPLGTIFHTGLWLTFELVSPGGSAEIHERELADRIGAAARQAGGSIPINLSVGSDTPPLVTPFDIYTTGFWPNLVPAGTLEQSRAAAMSSLEAISADAQRLIELDAAPDLSPADEADLRRIRYNFQVNMARYLGDVGLVFAEAADRLLVDTQAGVFVRAYYDSPRLVIVGVQPGDGANPVFTLDLRDTTVRTFSYPGQAQTAVFGFNMVKGIIESGLEGAALSVALGQTALTTSRLFEAATAQGIVSTIVTVDNLPWLENLPLSEEAKARITSAALEGKILIVPQEPVWIDGDVHLGWWEVDRLSGETIGVMENGLHLAALEYLLGLGVGAIVGGPITDLILGYTSYVLGFVADRIDKAIGDNTFDLDMYLYQVSVIATATTCLTGLASIIFDPDVLAFGSCGAGLIGAAGGPGAEPTDFFGLGQKIAQTYLNSVVDYDPPVPQNWQAVAPPDNSQAQVSAVVPVSAAIAAVNLDASLATGDATVIGDVAGNWTAASHHSFTVNSLTASGILRDVGGLSLGSGTVTAVPASGAVFTLQASPAGVAVDGNGRFSFYAAAQDGLGSGASWDEFTARLTPGGIDTLLLWDAQVTLNGVTHTGSFTLETGSPIDITGLAAGAAPNFAASANWQTVDAQVRIGPASGTATVGGTSLDVGNGLAVAGYDGALPVSETVPAADQVALNDNVDFFTLNLTPSSSSTDPEIAVTFQTEIFANFTGMYTLTVDAPAGWDVQLANDGMVTALPAVGATPGDYPIWVIARSALYPDLVLSAFHTVTVTSFDGFTLAVLPDEDFTVPMGPVLDPDAVTGSTNTGQAQIPGAAYTVFITNTANVLRTYSLAVTGLPAGWTLLSKGERSTSTSLSLPPGALGMLGLYIDPDTDVLPAPGTVYAFTVTAVSDSGLSDSQNLTFTMPAVPFSYVTVDPPYHYVEQGSQTTLELGLTNVGNAAGSFSLFATPAITTITPVSPLQTPLFLNPGETTVQQVTLAVGDAPLGLLFPVWFSSPAPGGVYTQTNATHVRVVNPVVGPIFTAAQCTLGSTALQNAVINLGVAVIELQQWCESGECPLVLRDRVVAAAESVAAYASGASNRQVTADAAVLAAAASLSAHTDPADIAADLQTLSGAVADLGSEVCELEEHMPEARFTPYVDAILLGDTAAFSLTVTNRGALTTTYAITVTTPSGVQTFNPDIAPGAVVALPVDTLPTALGVYTLFAEIVAVAPDVQMDIRAQAQARLNVVDRFVQFTAVIPDPPFVETGVSSTTISVDISNIANIALPAIARTSILAPDGGTAYSGDLPLTVLAGAPRNYTLETVNTSGWAAGVYTVIVNLLDQSAATVIPDGSGYGYLGVGQALGIRHAVSPGVVPPGTVTVTTRISSEILSPLIIPPAEMSLQGIGHAFPIANIDALPSLSLPPEALESLDAITRTEDLDASIVYTGAWTPVTVIAWARHTSQGSYTVSDTPGNTATFAFDGTWLHIGFATDRFGGQAEILIDGTNYGIVDTYSHQVDVASFVYSGLADTAHTLTINVLGAAHPNAIGEEVKLDYIDAWDGTLYPDGLVEQTSSRVWRSLDWSDVSDTDASGGSYMTNNVNGSAWFPFTGDSVTLMVFASFQGNRIRIAIDGTWQTNFKIYNSADITRTISFDNLGPGPHVMQVRRYYNSAQVDGFITPAIEPGFTPPSYTGIVRYEADHPAVLYNGYPMPVMPQSWGRDVLPNVSDSTVSRSTTLSDTISLNFDGRWVSIGLRTRSDGGHAEIFIDGVSHGIIDSFSSVENLRSFQFGDLVAGAHTLEIVVLDAPNPLNNYVYLDYIDVWDGALMPDDFANAHKALDSGRLHYSSSGADDVNANAFQGDYLSSGLPNTNSNVWYLFTGDSFTFYGLSRDNTSSQEIYVDGELVDTVSLSYPFSEQPLAFHYTGFGEGPHSVRVHNVWEMRVDGFASNPASLAPFQPLVEWHESYQTRGASIWGGLHVPVAVGDVTGDGAPEIVVASSNIQSNGELFVLRGDGSDTGDGTPIIWSVPYNIFNGFEDVAAPAIAELDGQPGAEIIHPTVEGLYVYNSDGTIYWYTDTVQSHVFFAAPAVGNLDLDPEPEIVVNMGNDLVVFEADGQLAWLQAFPARLSMPVLADLNGDGLLDILVHESGTTNIHAYNYNLGSPVLLWSQSVATQLHIYGAPVVVDVDGQQPGGDPLPEVAVASEGWLNVLNAEDGSLLWSTPLGSGRSGGVSAADLDGDGEVELVTSMEFNGGRIYVLNADGSLLWSAPALDNSPLNVSVMDLNNDGVYEVAWNGATGGFTLFNGADGAVLFNEPHLEIVSQTGSDYPVFADVDLDGYGEVVVASQAGLRVFGFDGVWGPARPLWNQHSYHITNVNDDLSVPVNEPDSWEVHNTYRTQTSLVNPLPVFSVSLTHTVGITGVSVLTGTFSTPPDGQAYPDYGWQYTQSWTDLVVTRSFDLRVEDLHPGESRMVGQRTIVDYRLPSGMNHLELPPLYVSAPHIVVISPDVITVASGGVTQFDVTLLNPDRESADTYTLSLVGVLNQWASYPSTVSIAAGEEVTVPLSIIVPPGADPDTLPVILDVVNSSGGSDHAMAQLIVIDGVDVGIAPDRQTAIAGETVTYTLTISNYEGVQRTYHLSATGLAGVSLPPPVAVDAGDAASVSFTVSAPNSGPQPFTVVAAVPGGASDSADAVLDVSGAPLAALSLAPNPAVTGPGSTAVLILTVTNVGDLVGAFDLSVDVPSGWGYVLQANGQPVSSVTLPPYLFNTANLVLLVTPGVGAATGDYPVTVAAAPQGNPGGVVSTSGTVQVLDRGVQVEFLSGPSSLDPRQTGVWNLRLTNTGQVADTFNLQAIGILALAGQFSVDAVTLNPGGSQTVQLTGDNLDFLLPQTYPVIVAAVSQADSRISDQAEMAVALIGYEEVQVAWRPEAQTVNGALSASFSLVITNTGNLNTAFQISGGVSPGGELLFQIDRLDIPARSAAILLVAIEVPQGGVYQVSATVQGGQAQDSASAGLTVIFASEPPRQYLPLISRKTTP